MYKTLWALLNLWLEKRMQFQYDKEQVSARILTQNLGLTELSLNKNLSVLKRNFHYWRYAGIIFTLHVYFFSRNTHDKDESILTSYWNIALILDNLDKAVQIIEIKPNKKVQYFKLKFWYATPTSQLPLV